MVAAPRREPDSELSQAAPPGRDEAITAGAALIRLRQAGWSVGETAFSGPGGTTWVVSGSNGENLIRASGPTADAAWLEAERQARELGMLDGRVGGSSFGN
jgi:hypothetical protein